MTRSPRLSPFKSASTLLGAFFCLLVTACNEKKATADWEQSTPQATAAAEPSQPTKKAAPTKPARPAPPQQTGNNQEIRFLAYNLENYLTMRRYINGKAYQRSKPEKEIAALIRVIKSARPAILGVCEIGSDADLKDLQSRLQTAGIDLPHAHRVQGADTVRALAILSRYPIVATAVPKKLDYTLNGNPFQVSRGILDTTIQLPHRKVRFLGVHLKSKRPIKGADQELMRRNESLLLRKHIDAILTTSPDSQILVYGDFNDTTHTKSISTVRGRANSPKRLKAIDLTDSRGENWTHNWKREDVYSRFDYVMTTPNLAPHIDKKGSRLLDHKAWELASDHRALLILIK
jgi:endonuclease/exonuclease/phosphatase family metal-dependent hydrolase